MSWLELGQIVIGKLSSEYVRINITDRSDPEGWLTTSAEVSVGPWKGAFGAWFHSGELRRFASEVETLHRDLVGPALLMPMEPYLELNFCR
jgi:hypothetical protein